jgi:hypothetical protein
MPLGVGKASHHVDGLATDRATSTENLDLPLLSLSHQSVSAEKALFASHRGRRTRNQARSKWWRDSVRIIARVNADPAQAAPQSAVNLHSHPRRSDATFLVFLGDPLCAAYFRNPHGLWTPTWTPAGWFKLAALLGLRLSALNWLRSRGPSARGHAPGLDRGSDPGGLDPWSSTGTSRPASFRVCPEQSPGTNERGETESPECI